MANEYYAIASTIVGLTGLEGTNLVMEPFPTEYEPGEEVATDGVSEPVIVGFPWAIWKWDVPITAACMKTFTDLLAGAQSVAVFIRTRTNIPEADGTYEYKNFSAKMWKPKADPHPGYMYDNVEIEFRRLVEQT